MFNVVSFGQLVSNIVKQSVGILKISTMSRRFTVPVYSDIARNGIGQGGRGRPGPRHRGPRHRGAHAIEKLPP